MGTFISIAQVIAALSILVVLHEFGHFLPAKLFKTKVEKFYLFFNPWFSLFKIKKGETEYGLGWLPLGGYVKISGMIDESMDKDQLKKPPEPWEFRSKPAWQRLIIMTGGVIVNIILGILIFAMVLFVWGETYLPNENAKYGIACDTLALEMGLLDGDKIVSADDIPISRFNEITLDILLEQRKSIQVERNGQKLNIPIGDTTLSKLLLNRKLFIQPRYPCVVDSILPGSNAEKAGLMPGDKIIRFNNISIGFFQDVVKEIKRHKGENVTLEVNRNSQTITLNGTVHENGTLGFTNEESSQFLEFKHIPFGFLESFPAGIDKGYQTLKSYIKQMRLLVEVEDAYKGMGSLFTIGQAFGKVWIWEKFWRLTAFLSIVLAVMNILPIPALDGGHAMFILYELVAGRKPHDKVVEYAQVAGMVLLLALMAFVLFNDFVRNVLGFLY